MRKGTLWLMAVATTALAIAMAFRERAGLEQHPDVAASQPGKSSGSIAVIAPEKSGRDARPERTRSTLSELSDDRPFGEVRPELEKRALAGDAVAARRLGMVLGYCNGYVPIPDERIEDIVVDAAAGGVSVRQNGRELSPQEMLSMLQLGVAQKNRDCKGVSGLNESDASQKAFQWIERGAALGDGDAQALYGTLAFADYGVQDALIDAERIRERKQLAIGYMQQSIAQGDAMALLQLSSQYNAGPLYRRNAETSYAYLYAYSLTTRASDIVPALLAQLLATRAVSLDPEALERARIQGLQLASCCELAPTPAAP